MATSLLRIQRAFATGARGQASPFRATSVLPLSSSAFHQGGHRSLSTSRALLGYPRFPPIPNHIPPPAPREYNADGTPRKYRLMQWTYDHPYDWERWSLCWAGPFHTYYAGEFAKEMPWYHAWLCSFPAYALIPATIVLFFCIVQVGFQGGALGIKPKRYTIEWIEAMKERDRVENSNPVTRYLERRRKERGPHWILADYLPKSPYWMYVTNHHDTELLRKREKKAMKILGMTDGAEEDADDDE